MDQLVGLAPILLLVVAFYFLLIRPQKNRAKAQAQMQANLSVGVEVMTTAGIFGTIVNAADDELLLEISPGTVIRILPAAVARVVTPPVNSDDQLPE